MAKYEQICNGDTPATKKNAKYCKKRAARAANKRIISAYMVGDNYRAEKDHLHHKNMAGWTK